MFKPMKDEYFVTIPMPVLDRLICDIAVDADNHPFNGEDVKKLSSLGLEHITTILDADGDFYVSARHTDMIGKTISVLVFNDGGWEMMEAIGKHDTWTEKTND